MDYVITRTQLDAAGHKLRRTVNSGGIIETTDYAGNAVYDGFSLAMLQIPGGYVTLSSTTPTYHYYLHYYPSLNPYTYCANSPANIVDPNGMDWFFNAETGELIRNVKNDTDYIVLITPDQIHIAEIK